MYNDHCCFLEANRDVTCRGNCVCARKRAVYWSGKRRGSTMQTTTVVSADVPAQTQHITKARSLWIEKATRPHHADDHHRSTSLRTCQQECRRLWIGEATRLHDADDHCRFRWRASTDAISRRVKVYGSRNQRGPMTQTTTTASAGMPARMQKSMDRGDAAPRCRRPLSFPLTCNISRRVEVYGSRKRRGSMTQTTTTVSAGMPARMQKSTLNQKYTHVRVSVTYIYTCMYFDVCHTNLHTRTCVYVYVYIYLHVKHICTSVHNTYVRICIHIVYE